MKYYEFVVTKNGWMMGSFSRKADAKAYAAELIAEFPAQPVAIKAHVYSVPLNRYDVGDHYLYSYDVPVE